METILDEVKHKKILDDLTRLSQHAGVLPSHILYAASESGCGPVETTWIKGFFDNVEEGCYGLCYKGKIKPSMETRMQGVAGALVRSFIDARVMSVHQILLALKRGDDVGATVILVPNFFVSKKESSLYENQVTALYDWLLSRKLAGKQTVLALVKDKELLAGYGAQMTAFIGSSFKMVED